MNPPYDDIRSRIAEEPAWYDCHGVPRYGTPPDHLRSFMRGIKCQRCLREFRVCLVGEIHHGLYGESVVVRLGEPCPADAKAFHAGVSVSSLRHYRDGRWEDDPLPDNWHYGDPPFHAEDDGRACVGTTMNSIPEYEWKEFETEEGFIG